jgi:hypothetical protein
MERFEIGFTAANNPLSSTEDRPLACRYFPGSTKSPGGMPMKPMELFQRAVAEIGNVSPAELSEHLEMKHGVKIEPAFIPLFKATLQDLERTNKFRQDVKSIPSEQPSSAEVDDLLDVSRISRGKLSLRKERVKVSTVLNIERPFQKMSQILPLPNSRENQQ